MTAELMKMLREEYNKATLLKAQKKLEIRAKHKELQRIAEREEIEAVNDVIDAKVGELLVRVLATGAKRKDIWSKVFGTNDNDKWNRLVTLGGGEIRKKRTGEEIAQEIEAVSNARRDELLSLLNLEFTGIKDFMGRGEFPHFTVTLDGSEVYLDKGTVWPVGRAGQTYHDLRKCKDEIRELASFYEGESND